MQLTPQQLKGLDLPCASGKDLSILYRKILSPLYDVEVEKIPSWIAPNLLTLSGLMCTLSNTVMMLYYSPDLVSEAPKRVYLSAAFATFLYMMFDNLDGRQARRTNSSSPLGHLFDHGCDALNVTILGLAVAATLRLGRSFATLFLVWSLGMIPFFFATLEEFFCGSLTLRLINGANEALKLVGYSFVSSALDSLFVIPFDYSYSPFLLLCNLASSYENNYHLSVSFSSVLLDNFCNFWTLFFGCFLLGVFSKTSLYGSLFIIHGNYRIAIF
ncbi:Choline/ethanolaminephosphotransferase 2 [Galdieria sulphuraria]|nr:Choline/ethanolaminephosphotransferase 2 [Galdieria sulphuraria]